MSQPNIDSGRNRREFWRAHGVRSLMIAATCCSAVTAHAREPAEEFVTALRNRGLYELAQDYLTQMETSRLAETEFRERIPYHRGIILIAEARQTADVAERTALFGKARRELDQFVVAHPDSPVAAEALLELANVQVDQAKQLLAQVEQMPDESTYAEQRDKLQDEARRLLVEAQPKFKQAEAFYTTAIEKIPKTLDPKTQGDLITQRQEFRGRLAQVTVLSAQADFEVASTYPANSDEFVKVNEETAKKLASLYEKYSRWLVGYYARMYEGRCYQALGDYQRALGCYEELISQSSVHPAFRKLIASAYGYQAQCLVAQGKFDAAMANTSTWLSAAQGDEATMPEWLFVRYELAEALRAKSESKDTKQSEKRGLIIAAREAYRVVAATPNDLQIRARAAAAALGPSERAQREVPRDFVAAYQAGKDAMASVNAAKLAIPSAAKNNPTAIPELRLQADESKNEAQYYFALALSLVDDDTKIEQLNEVRYFLCWLDWENGNYYRAAVLGDFLARRYPEHPAAAASAKLALASYERLQQLAIQAGGRAEDTEFEARKMAEIADFMTRRWPDSQAAETAQRVLVSYAIRSNRIDEAKDLLDKVPAASRPTYEAQLGNALWGRYLQQSQNKGAEKLSESELTALRDEAIKLMQCGFKSARESGQVNEVTATSGLYLIQALMNEGKFAEAVQLLEDAKVGPLMLVREANPAAARPEYVIEVYKAALRAYVSVSPPQIEQAIATMSGLESASNSSNSLPNDQLMRIYMSLAKALSDQLANLRASGNTTDVARMSLAFGKFLDQMGKNQSDANWATRYWIAQTYYTMGESLRGDAATPRTDAKSYFAKARDAFAQLNDEAEKDPSVLPSPTAKLAVEKQQGDCYRELGEFEKALNAFSTVLADQESQLTVQQAAARTYQQWGAAGGGIPKLERAIYGGYKLRTTGKNRVWGWLKLALVSERAARSDPKYEDVFFEARLEAARCRYLIGLKSKDAEREKNLATAKQSIRSMLQLYPELGGERWRSEFEDLLKQIQKSAGEKPSGLNEFKVARE